MIAVHIPSLAAAAKTKTEHLYTGRIVKESEIIQEMIN